MTSNKTCFPARNLLAPNNMTIYKEFSGCPRPDMPEGTVLLGKITTQHMTRTDYEWWYSDDLANDRHLFEEAKRCAEEISSKSMPSRWM